jgi:phosphonate transport system permease protein
MDTQKEGIKIRHGIKISFWILFLALFIYSFQSIMDLEAITNPRRQKSFMRVLTDFSKPNFSEDKVIRQAVREMWETVQIALLATTISAVFAIPFTFFSARPSSSWGRGFNLLLQPILSVVRAVHPLVVTIPAAFLAGIGPAAGVLALTLFSTAILISNYSEYAQQHTSLNWGSLFTVYFPGLALKHFPVNILIASVLGFMGGGGIGFLLIQEINLLNYSNASVGILACIIVIGGIDLLSRAVWRKIQNNTDATRID